ncbi:hypothetical protein J2W39_000213 [Variovorax paradoxus]|uniref:DmpG-like communication domain-containing protein n=1 Tax=Variovorax paradoxus TaxID=34073 RepID=A0AAW8E820_VARPD|nr:hypothetical protein [Variovorax paradoxus]MDP9968990.1 hypothetical protein [Variovorax paradoxus]
MTKSSSRIPVAILGSGNIGTDLLYKLRRNPRFDLRLLAGIDAASEGLARARELGCATSTDGVEPVLEAADVFSRQVAPQPMPVIDNDSILMGYANVYGGYAHPIKHAAQLYGCDARELVLRLGERKVVAAQEDVVIEEAQRLGALLRKAA